VRTIGVVTVARSDYGIYRPLLSAIQQDSELNLHLIVAGMHLSPEFGLTIRDIEADAFPIGDRIEMLLSSDSPEGIAKSMGLATVGYAQCFGSLRPDILVVLGDRFEMHAAAVAALPFRIPVAHIHGGELTQGAIDDALRHSMTKLSHLHFVSTEQYAQRVIQMGEEPWRVINCGALGLDNLKTTRLLEKSEIEAQYGLRLDRSPLLVTFHPVTLEYDQVEHQFAELLSALDQFDRPIVFTAPNSDTGGRAIFSMISKFVETHRSAAFIGNLGTQGYFSLMTVSAAMVGNSSSGVIEATSFKLPVVNIGNRQAGRVRSKSVIDVGCSSSEIGQGLDKALDADFRDELRDCMNPYDRGGASQIIVERLRTTNLDGLLLMKRFHDISLAARPDNSTGISTCIQTTPACA
jgi:UDP-hydrolysing UDP-N-acetyl-D-glucosamine 2-epimerase